MALVVSPFHAGLRASELTKLELVNVDLNSRIHFISLYLHIGYGPPIIG